MKTIIISFIAIFLTSIIAVGQSTLTNSKNIILLQAADSSVSSTSLNESANIISNRLKDFKSNRFTVHVIPDLNQIQVILKGDWDIEVTKSLVSQKGSFAIYETYNRKSLSNLWVDAFQFFQNYNTTDLYESASEIAIVSPDGIEEINNHIDNLGPNQQCRFVWGHKRFENSYASLYALKVNGADGAIITNSDIERVKYSLDKVLGSYELQISLKQSSAKVWADATERNINNALVFLLDQTFVSAPRVNSPITGGQASIVSNFTKDEVRYLASLITNRELPIHLKVLK